VFAGSDELHLFLNPQQYRQFEADFGKHVQTARQIFENCAVRQGIDAGVAAATTKLRMLMFAHTTPCAVPEAWLARVRLAADAKLLVLRQEKRNLMVPLWELMRRCQQERSLDPHHVLTVIDSLQPQPLVSQFKDMQEKYHSLLRALKTVTIAEAEDLSATNADVFCPTPYVKPMLCTIVEFMQLMAALTGMIERLLFENMFDIS
jgi:hypothetical protein